MKSSLKWSPWFCSLVSTRQWPAQSSQVWSQLRYFSAQKPSCLFCTWNKCPGPSSFLDTIAKMALSSGDSHSHILSVSSVPLPRHVYLSLIATDDLYWEAVVASGPLSHGDFSSTTFYKQQSRCRTPEPAWHFSKPPLWDPSSWIRCRLHENTDFSRPFEGSALRAWMSPHSGCSIEASSASELRTELTTEK